MARYKILIVEDDPDLRETLTMLLEDTYDVSSAADGLVGLKNALRNPPDLILMDLKMPNMDGFETCKLLRADKEFDDISIIVVSGFVSDQDRVKALEAGADDFIGKPFETSELLHRIQKRLEEKNRSKSQAQLIRQGIFRYKNLRMETSEMKAFLGDDEVHFSHVEFSILRLLVEHAESIVAREAFISSIWPDQEVSNRIMDAHIVSIRNKLKGHGLQITSVYGKGYVLRAT